MPARNANNATWYMLRYATDFAPRVPAASDPAPPQFVPASDPALFYDDVRNVLELLAVVATWQPPRLAQLTVATVSKRRIVRSVCGREVAEIQQPREKRVQSRSSVR